MLSEFLNQNESALTVIFSALITFVTIIYAFLTWRLFSETKRMREAQTEPKISIMVQPREEWINFIDLIVQNIGLGAAYNLQFMVKPDFKTEFGVFLTELGFMKNGLKYLAPNQKIQYFLKNCVGNYGEIIFEIKVTYQNSIGKKYEDSYLIDFSQFADLNQIGIPPLHTISKNIEQIRDDIHKISNGYHKMKVVMYTKKEEEDEKEKSIEEYKKVRMAAPKAVEKKPSND